MTKFTPSEVSIWTNKLNPIFKDALITLELSCTSFFHQIKVDDPPLHATTEYWIPTCHVFQFNGVELCPTIEEFCVIMDEYKFGAIILPPLEEDLFDLAHQILGAYLGMVKRWCKSNKLNVSMVFKYFSWKGVPLARANSSHHLNAFCICILARFFLVLETPHMDHGILHVVKQLGSGSLLIFNLLRLLISSLNFFLSLIFPLNTHAFFFLPQIRLYEKLKLIHCPRILFNRFI